MRDRMLDQIRELGAVAVVRARPSGRRGQVGARAELLPTILAAVVAEGISHLVIESRGSREDGRDRGVILDSFHATDVPFTYDWRTKAEPLLWMADAAAGSCRQLIEGGDSNSYDRLVNERVLDGILYR